MKKEMEIESMSNEGVLQELKAKGLPTFGTQQERKDRLKKALGKFILSLLQAFKQLLLDRIKVTTFRSKKNQICQVFKRRNQMQLRILKGNSNETDEFRLARQREERRKQMEEKKIQKLERDKINQAVGRNVDVDFDIMMEKFRLNPHEIKPHLPSEGMRICLCVRKRPIF